MRDISPIFRICILSPIYDPPPKLNNPQMYAYPFTAITLKTTALLRFVNKLYLLAPEHSGIVEFVKAMAPVQPCKQCATSWFLPAIYDYCLSPILNSVI
ncbi:MAG: DUF2193 family protein [Methanosarcinales archaeon]